MLIKCCPESTWYVCNIGMVVCIVIIADLSYPNYPSVISRCWTSVPIAGGLSCLAVALVGAFKKDKVDGWQL